MVQEGDLLTTSEAAALLRSSRQHVVDMCERGLLPFVKVGAHRRLHRADVEAVLRPELTRDQLKALWLHRAVAGRLVQDPDAVLARASANLERLRRVHPDGMAARWLDRWAEVLDAGVEAVLDTLVSRAPVAIELRQNSPFAGVLPEPERRAVLAAFADRWRSTHAA
ncbi:helix-turn-helix domain-containing protein [Phytohabitans sp. ZYX-F-186]|uniref:Helix-turn-helix domain-containing protein n=1 Tax=Phytohabitans maris TaxID=3071409 RepID=A0ABU0ZD61_9ACTN|nr:helix-turn-helix domain-containing protein [Phytohabitans sp. ZYX-F-186]MDQ7904326.1 helix-turn-helix domain-containing protein [Phytohabitans sp. ZYX-F-186]